MVKKIHLFGGVLYDQKYFAHNRKGYNFTIRFFQILNKKVIK